MGADIEHATAAAQHSFFGASRSKFAILPLMGVDVVAHEHSAAAAQHSFLGASRSQYAILVAGYGTEYLRQAYGGLACVFQRMLIDPGETWHTYRVLDGQFPKDEDLDKYAGFVITGSKCDAHGSEAWILELCELVRKLHKKKKKLLGICFGHQVIARALGGKTGRSVNGWEVGLRNISITDSFYAKTFGITLPSTAVIVEIHQDQVYELPPGADKLASSKDTSMEMYAVQEHVLCIQGHPEFSKDIVLDILDLCLKGGQMPEEVVRQARLSLEEAKADQELFRQLCKSFLKRKPSPRKGFA